MSDHIIYIFYILFYILAYIKNNWDVSLEKNIYPHCSMQQVKISHLHICDLKSWLQYWWKLKSCEKNMALCCCSEDLITQQHNVMYQKTNFILHIPYRLTTCSDLKSIIFLINMCVCIYIYIYIYTASVNAFTMLVWWMHVYKFAALMINAQQRCHSVCVGKITVSVE